MTNKILIITGMVILNTAAALAQTTTTPEPSGAKPSLPTCSAADAALVRSGKEPQTPCHANLVAGPGTVPMTVPVVPAPVRP